MKKWDWDWLLENKFETLCKEFGGVFYKKSDGTITHPPLTCDIENYDDFKAFTHWMNKQPTKGNDITMTATHTYNDEPDHTFHAEFYFRRRDNQHYDKNLIIQVRKSLGDAEGISDNIREELSEQGQPAQELLNNWKENFYNTKNDTKELIDTIEKPYLREHASIDTVFDNNDDHWYAEAEINFPIKEWGNYPSILEDSDEAVSDLASKAEDKFNDKIHKEIERLKETRP